MKVVKARNRRPALCGAQNRIDRIWFCLEKPVYPSRKSGSRAMPSAAERRFKVALSGERADLKPTVITGCVFTSTDFSTALAWEFIGWQTPEPDH
jgi:hypothetical protein